MTLPKFVELQRLKRLKEVFSSKTESRAHMLPVKEREEDLEDRITALEKGLGLTDRCAA